MAALWTIHQVLMVLFYRDVKSTESTQVAGDYESLDNDEDNEVPTPTTTVQVSTWKEMAIGTCWEFFKFVGELLNFPAIFQL